MFRGLALSALVALVCGVAAPACAQTAISQYPFCIQGDDNPGWSGCSFNTLQACQAAASGTLAECTSNPWYQADTAAAPVSDDNQIGANAPLPVGPPPN
jgi:hypothetical protein